MSREQIYVGSGVVTILLDNKFYNIDKNAYYFKNGTIYEPNYFVIFENKLYKVLNKTNKSPIEDSTSYQLQVSIDDLTVNALSDDIEDVKKEISGGEGETEQDLTEIKKEISNLQQNVETITQDIEQNYLKTDNFANEFNNNLEQSAINADQIDGVLDVDNIPATALPIVKIVENESAMFALSSSDVQIGDVVKVQDTNKLYYVIDDTNLDNIAGYTEFNASVDWSTITNKPNEFTPVKHTHTLSDITNSNTLALKTDVDAKLNIDTYNQDQEKVVKYQEFIYDGQTRKTIQLNNYDSISGVGTDGHGYNIAMVSKWDKVDLGTASLTMNLNSKDGIVQINDEKTVATLDDLASYTKNVDFEGYKTTVANDIASINGKFDEYALKVDIPNTDNFVTSETFNNALETVNSAIDSKAEKIAVDSIVENVNTINSKLETVVSYSHDDANNKDTVLLKNHDSISGLDTNGTGYNLVMVSKWNKADFGSSGIQMNLNSLNGVVQINDDKTVATVDQIPSVDNLVTVETFNTNIETINNKFNDYALKSEIPDVSIYAKNEDLKHIADTVIPEMNTNTANALNLKVDWDSEKKVIALPKDGSISALRNGETLEGGNLLAQRTYDSGATFVTEVGTTKNKLTLNASERPQIDIQGQESQKVAFVSDIPNDVYYLGNFSLSLTAENKAKEDGIYNNINYKVLTYTVNNSDNGFIINNVASDKTTQFLNYKGVQYKREIVSGEATSWVEMDTSIMLKGKAVNGIKLFKLTTDSTDTEIQEALSAGGSLITEDDLNTCLTKGYTLREYSMQSPSIFVGFTGQGFTLSYFGFANPSQDSALMSIVIAINDGVYSVLKNATRALAITTSNIATNSTITSLTDRIQELESTCPKMVNIPIRTLKDEVYSKEDILGWFGVEDDPALKKIISGLAPMYLRYGILLSGNPHYYKMPIQYIAYETANQVKMVVVGLDTSNDVVSKYEIILNLDGTIIEGNSNVKVTITNLENDANVSDLESRIQAIEKKIN